MPRHNAPAPMKTKRNIDKTTDAATVEANIVASMQAYRCTYGNPVPLSCLGQWGFRGYDFGRSQGAAFAVSRIAKDMERRGVIGWRSDGKSGPRGYYLKRA